MSSPEAPPTDAADDQEEPVDNQREEIVSTLAAELGEGLVAHHIDPGRDLWVRVHRDAWTDAGRAVRDVLGCRFFDFLSVIDWLPSPFGRDMDAEQDWVVHGKEERELPAMETGYAGGETRFQVFARVHSVTDHIGLTLKADLPNDDLTVDSWIPIFAGANWHEREAWEMYGVVFNGHPDMRHLYLPGGFEGNPLRKDYPLLSRRVKPWPGIVDVEGMPGEDQ